MTFYRRRLPHIYKPHQPVFLTWRLHDTLPSNRTFPAAALNSGQAFAAMERGMGDQGSPADEGVRPTSVQEL
jgi:hypothetical protein